MKKITLCAAFAIIVAVGCAKKPVVKDALPEPPVETIEPADSTPAAIDLQANVSVIDVFDDRSGVEEPDRLLHMPDWTIVGQKDVIRPALLDEHRQIIRGETQSHFLPGTKTVSVEVYVLEGKQSYVAGERKESITAEFSVRIEIANLRAVHDVKTATGRASIEKEELEINYQDVHALYEEAIRASIRDALGRIRG